MNPSYWPYSWQRLFCRIVLVTYIDRCDEQYIAHFRAGGKQEFRSMDELDTYARAIHRIDYANGEEIRKVNGIYDWHSFLRDTGRL